MATIKATFFTFTKRDNSTLKPVTGGVELSISWKEETDILSPQLEVRYDSAFNFNYCYIDFTGRYYKINQATSIAYQTYLLQCEHDVLANWIDDAKGQSVYADYSSYDYDIWLDDNRITAGHTVTRKSGGEHSPLCIMPVDQQSPTPQMNEVLAAVSATGLLNGIDFLYGGVGSLSDIIQKFADLSFLDTIKSGSPWDAICEAYYTPLNPTQCQGVTSEPHEAIIWGNSFSKYALIGARTIAHTTTLALPVPSNIDFRFSEKYVKYYLNIPYSGIITIPTSLVLASYQETGGHPVANIIYSGDFISGQFAAEVKVAGVSLGMFGANLKVSIQLGGRMTTESYMLKQGVMGALAAAGGSVVLGAPMGAIVGLAAGGAIGGAIKGALDIPPLETFGNYSGNAALPALGQSVHKFAAIALECDSNINPATLTAIAGRPSGKVTTIQNGYIKTINASVAFDGLAEEVTAFNALLNGGIYVE